MKTKPAQEYHMSGVGRRLVRILMCGLQLRVEDRKLQLS